MTQWQAVQDKTNFHLCAMQSNMQESDTSLEPSHDFGSELSPAVCEFLTNKAEPTFNCNFRDYGRKRNIALLIQYEGTDFSGWQRQTNAPSVQACLESALSTICQEEILIYGCSRTDAGVHAIAYVASFYTNCAIPVQNLPLACRSLLPTTISVLKAYEMPHSFNARFSTLAKAYNYDLVLAKVQPALYSKTYVQCFYALDLEKMRQAAKLIVGEHDFRAFCGAKAEVNSYVRRVLAIELFTADTSYPAYLPCLRIRVTGEGFLYNMVRIIAGTLVFVGANKLSLTEVEQAIITGNRKLAGPTLEAKGLTLAQVFYVKELKKLAIRRTEL